MGRPLRRRWKLRHRWLALGLIVLAAGIVPAWRSAEFVYQSSRGDQALAAEQFPSAVSRFERAQRLRPGDAGMAYRLAVAYRRAGQFDRVKAQLDAAQRLGWAADQVRLQRLLARAQMGAFREVEQELRAYFEQGADDATALEVYEALALGYWTDHDLTEALRCLEFWIAWRPRDVTPRLMKAEIFNTNHDAVSAEREYRQILEFAPRHGMTREALGRLLLRRGQVEEAVQQLRRCQEAGHDSVLLQVALAEGEFRSGQADAAADRLKTVQLRGLSPEQQAEALKLTADIARFQRDPPRAVELLERAIAIWPHNGGIHEMLAQSYTAVGKPELAERHLKLCREMNERSQQFNDLQRDVIRHPTDPERRFQIGEILRQQGFGQDAAGWWTSALRCDAHHQASHEALAEFHQQRGDADRAARHRRSAQLAAEVTFRRAWGALQAGDLEAAARGQQLLAAYPERQDHARLLAAGRLAKDKDFSAAAALLETLPADAGLRPLALTVRAECRIGEGRLILAEPILLEVLQQHPADVTALRWLAVLYYDLGAVEQADYYLKKVAELDPTDYRAPWLLGLMHQDFEHPADAVLHYRESFRRNPQQSSREQVLLGWAECLIKLLKHGEALSVLAQCQPSVAQQMLTAECLFHTGEQARAAEQAREVRRTAPDDLRALLLLGDIALAERQYSQAAEMLREAVRQHPFDYTAHHKLAQALTHLAADEQELAQIRQRADELKSAWQGFSELHKQATEAPHDVAIREKLAQQAEQLGRQDLAEVWRKAVQGLRDHTAAPADVER